MIKAKMRDKNGRPVYFFGLSRMNLERLAAGDDVFFDGAQLGLDGHVCISFGETEQAIAKRIGMPEIQPRQGEQFVFDPVFGMRAQKSRKPGER